jgi:hypothetical protein
VIKEQLEKAFEKNKIPILKAVHGRKDKEKVIAMIGLSLSEVFNSVFESCSLVLAMKDKKTLIEICFEPEMIELWEEEDNPLFQHSQL